MNAKFDQARNGVRTWGPFLSVLVVVLTILIFVIFPHSTRQQVAGMTICGKAPDGYQIISGVEAKMGGKSITILEAIASSGQRITSRTVTIPACVSPNVNYYNDNNLEVRIDGKWVFLASAVWTYKSPLP